MAWYTMSLELQGKLLEHGSQRHLGFEDVTMYSILEPGFTITLILNLLDFTCFFMSLVNGSLMNGIDRK